ncbi:hypothetical protein HPP92_019761 [Vanilla planifolia]|uniref:AB hydrolase-1 domain-containing protein n=1 Tax=Vanilla planifolia TaxID=51239 RepID=A0A835Q9E9_VANPL|nr:hypothetical protein HPP92_019761 [Vanilla planifolia]
MGRREGKRCLCWMARDDVYMCEEFREASTSMMMGWLWPWPMNMLRRRGRGLVGLEEGVFSARAVCIECNHVVLKAAKSLESWTVPPLQFAVDWGSLVPEAWQLQVGYPFVDGLQYLFQFLVSSLVMSSTVSISKVHPSSKFGSSGPHNSNSQVSSLGQFQMDPHEGEETELLSASWNQDYGCFAAGTSHGFRIYNCEPFKETFRRDLKSGGFGVVEMLFRCNILALVGGGANSQYPPNKVLIWDDHQGRCIGEFAFRSDVRGVRLKRDRIVVVLEHKIYVYNLTDLKLLHQIETLANPKGLCCLSHHSSTSVLACPGLHQGQVRVEHFGLKMTKIISAHDSHVSCLTLTLDGFLLATASKKGADRAEIYSIALSQNVQWLAVASDKGTVHIFNLRVRIVGEDALTESSGQGSDLVQQNSSTSLDPLISRNIGANPSSSLSFMRGVLPKYFSSEWSFAQFRLPEVTRFIAAFGTENTVMIVGMDGSFYRCSFDPVVGGTMKQEEYVRSSCKFHRRIRISSGLPPSSPTVGGRKTKTHILRLKTTLIPHSTSIGASVVDFPEQLGGDVTVKRGKKKSIAGVDQEELLDPEKLADPDSQFFEVNGVSFHHKTYHHEAEEGAKEGALRTRGGEMVSLGLPMILLHGFGASVFSWDRVMKPIARITGSKVLAFDRPAFGLTSRINYLETSGSGSSDAKPLNPYSMVFSVLATISFIDMLDSGKAILMGHSAGCLVAVNTYFESPERVAALILVAPAIFAPIFVKKEAKNGALRKKRKGNEGESDLEAVDNYFSRIWRGLCKLLGAVTGFWLKMVKEMTNMVGSLYVKAVIAVLRSALGVILVRIIIDKFGILAVRNAWYDASQVSDHVIQGYTKPLRAKGWDRALLEYTIALLTDSTSKSKPPISKRLAEITCPVLVVTGDTDRLVPPWNAKRLAQAIPGSTFEVITKCGHLPQEERVEDFLAIIERFLHNVFESKEEKWAKMVA